MYTDMALYCQILEQPQQSQSRFFFINNMSKNLNQQSILEKLETATSSLTTPLQPLSSSAFPSTKPIPQSTISHKIIRSSLSLSPTPSIRPSLPTDITEIRNLQLELFPLKYYDNFYKGVLSGEYHCLVAETQVVLNQSVLLSILKEQYEKQREIFENKKKYRFDKNTMILIQPSKYFEQQGIDLHQHPNPAPQQQTTSLLNSQQILINNEILDNPTQNHNPKQPQIESTKQYTKPNTEIKIKIIIGVLVFQRVSAKGYLEQTWWQTLLSTANNAFYISTIGVIEEFRKNGIARKMLNQLLSKTQNQTNIKFIHLHVIQYNIAAINLYTKIGFQQLQTIKNFYLIDNHPYSSKLFGLYLNGGKKKKPSWFKWISSFFQWQ